MSVNFFFKARPHLTCGFYLFLFLGFIYKNKEINQESTIVNYWWGSGLPVCHAKSKGPTTVGANLSLAE